MGTFELPALDHGQNLQFIYLQFEELIHKLDEDEEEDKEELQTLGRMATHGHRINRYFTADEGDEVEEDPNDITTNSDADSNQRFESSFDEAFDTKRDGD
jgi:hypothetical protein